MYFSRRLTLTIIEVGASPRVSAFEVIDATLGAAYDLHFVDMRMMTSGCHQLIVSTHEAGNGGSIYEYTFPSHSDFNSTFPIQYNRTVIASGFKVLNQGIREAAPGFLYPFDTNLLLNSNLTAYEKSLISTDRMSWMIAGDGSQGVNMLIPTKTTNSEHSYSNCRILSVGGTVGSLAVKTLIRKSSRGNVLELFVPNYDDNIIYLYSLN